MSDEDFPSRGVMVMARGKKREAALINRTDIRVRFSEVDSMHIVWHGEYVKYLEDGREAFGEEFLGIGYMDIYRSGCTAPIVELHLEYKRSLRCGEMATVETRYIKTEAAKICFDYIIRRQSSGEVVATGRSTQVFLDGDGNLMLTSPQFYTQWKVQWKIE